MGVLLEKYREKFETSYNLAGITADVAQLERAYIRGDARGIKKNITQIIRKLDKIKKSL